MKRTTERRTGRILFWLGLVMILSALSLAAYNVRDSERAGRAAQSALIELQTSIPTAEHAAPALYLPRSVFSGSDALAAEEAAIQIDDLRYLGVLSVPALALELPVQAGGSGSDLRQSPCRYSGRAETGDLVIAGHNYRTHFGPLSALSPGDRILWTSASGDRFFYSVDCTEALSPWQIEEMTCGDWDLTLFTCTTGGSARLAVRCVRETRE